MYYTSVNRQDLEQYNQYVSTLEGYDNFITSSWANIIEHKDGNLYAIMKHPRYLDNTGLLETLDSIDGWIDELI